MIALLCFFLTLLLSPFKSKSRLEAENAALRYQLAVLRRKTRGRVRLTNGDRLFLIQLYRWFPSVVPCPYRKSHPLASEDESGDALAGCGPVLPENHIRA
jgi:hypothetical protein